MLHDMDESLEALVHDVDASVVQRDTADGLDRPACGGDSSCRR